CSAGAWRAAGFGWALPRERRCPWPTTQNALEEARGTAFPATLRCDSKPAASCSRACGAPPGKKRPLEAVAALAPLLQLEPARNYGASFFDALPGLGGEGLHADGVAVGGGEFLAHRQYGVAGRAAAELVGLGQQRV